MTYTSLLMTAGLILGVNGIENSISEYVIFGTTLFLIGVISGFITEKKLDNKIKKLEKELYEIRNTQSNKEVNKKWNGMTLLDFLDNRKENNYDY